jgi:hypothetical protein
VAEKEPPTTVLAWLNEYFGALVPHITANGGVVDKFEGDALLAFFGILPRPLSPQESAYQACLAAVAMLQRVEFLNAQRLANGQPPFVTGISDSLRVGFLHSTILPNDFGLRWQFPALATRARNVVRAWNALGFILASRSVAARASDCGATPNIAAGWRRRSSWRSLYSGPVVAAALGKKITAYSY